MAQEQKALSIEKNNKRPYANNLSYILKRNWYWFVISVIVCLGFAFLYITYCPPTYSRTGSVLFRDNSSAHILNQSSEYPLDIQKNVDNEAFIFKSKQLMLKVAERLNLDINYTINDGLRKTELYTHSPITVSFPAASKTDQFSFIITPVSKDKVQLSHFSNDKNEVVEANLKENNTVSTPLGKIVINSSGYYDEKYFDLPVTIIKKNLEEVAQYYSDKLDVRIPEKSASVIEISLNDASVTRNEDIINTVIDIYNEEAINDRNQVIINTLDFINERLLSIEKELGNADADIEMIIPENQLTDVNPARSMYIKSSHLNRQEILDLQNRKTLARNICDYILDPKRSSDLIPAYTISDVNIERQITEYNNLILRRSKLISNNSDDNKSIEELNNSLALIKQNIIRDIGNFVLSTDSKIRNIREPEPAKFPTPAVPIPQKQVSLAEYQQKTKEALYLYLSKKKEDNTLLHAIRENDIQIIDQAKGPEKPTNPDTILIVLAALVAGIAIPLIVLWLKTVLNTTVRNRKDMEDMLSIPFLGDIPLQKKKQPGDIAVGLNSHEPISEAFRMIQANIDFMNNRTQGSQVIMVTSLAPGAGKTFVSINLAVSFALTRKKVILVDLDMRKGTLSSYINKSHPGISNFLSGKINNINEIIIKKTLYETLDFILAGPVAQNSAELLRSNRFDILIQDLKKHYDYVILDNATSNMVADTTIVNRISDLTLFIVRADKTDSRQLPELEKQYRNNKYNGMNVILNGVNY